MVGIPTPGLKWMNLGGYKRIMEDNNKLDRAKAWCFDNGVTVSQMEKCWDNALKDGHKMITSLDAHGHQWSILPKHILTNYLRCTTPQKRVKILRASMNERYIFRAWDKENKRMITDEQGAISLKVTNKGVLGLSAWHGEDLYSLRSSTRFQIMQCTGWRDKNGRLIFEGDVITSAFGYREKRNNFGIINTPKIAVIGWNNLNAQFDIWIVNSRVRMGFGDIQRKRDIEVIGNFYENPELLG